MVKISILYPGGNGLRFDLPYYVEKHMPLAIERLGAHPGYRGVSVEKGLAGAAPGSDPTYTAMCHFLFDSADTFAEAFSVHAPVLQGDIPNYTNASPVIQVSEVLISR